MNPLITSDFWSHCPRCIAGLLAIDPDTKFSPCSAPVPLTPNAAACEPITTEQRACLLHVLRNCATALNGVISMVENHATDPRPEDFATWLTATETALHQVVEAGKSGVFCSLRPDQCEFVGPCIGCPTAARRIEK